MEKILQLSALLLCLSLLLPAGMSNPFAYQGITMQIDAGSPRQIEAVDTDLEINANFQRVNTPYMTFYPERTVTLQYWINYMFVKTDSIEDQADGRLLYFSPYIGSGSGWCYEPEHPSLLGQFALFMDNGDQLFYNQNNETILIRTTAIADETWTVYQDDEFIIIGEVLSHALSQVLGQADSIKTIGFTVHDTQMQQIDNPLNNKTIQLSRENGLVSLFNFYSFPWEDDTYELAGISNPDLGVQNLTWMQVHDFMAGDELHVLEVESGGYYDLYPFTETHIIYKYLEREDLQDKVIYTIEKTSLTETLAHPDSLPSFSYAKTTYIHEVSPCEVFDTPALTPIYQFDGEDPFFLTFHIQADDYKSLSAVESGYDQDSDCWQFIVGYLCDPGLEYRKGLAGPYHYCEWMLKLSKRELVFYKKGDQTWGAPYIITSVKDPDFNSMVKVFPNPARDAFNLEIKGELLPAIITLTDVYGKTIMTEKIANTAENISVAGLPAGVYMYKVVFKGKEAVTGKIIVQ